MNGIERKLREGSVDLLAEINGFIRRGISFAIFHLPGSPVVNLAIQSEGSVRLFYDIEELNGKEGFVIAPFKINRQCPLVLIKPDIEVEVEFDRDKHLDMHSSELQTSPTANYSANFDVFINALQEKRFDKLVLSRSQDFDIESGFSPADVFFRASLTYVHSYVYLCYTPYTGVWLGSTPEVILSGEGDDWNTVALAGTQSLQNGQLPQEWDDKNRKEQEYVASYVRNQLETFGIRPIESGPYPAYAGALSHLKTDFKFSLPDNKRLGTLLDLLHPTPAVCGLPKEAAYRFILENERHDRCYYSGFVGMIAPDKKTDLYVNLRCMNIDTGKLTLYAGGGLLATSDLEDEWQETEKKMLTMLRMVKN
ncbi:isochorismate synthase [Oscillospiraceae bacterium N12]|jgi:isochorismate synthase|uniref:isochorismate synthase n=1 Tax=Jilunia laotingensis TaxID=2763675 RepID=A0A926F6I7_9BACT|nr:isochorismate synthase [Jilunia laotingensis]MBC8595148.1 isochorismate synthase [Jilunia laotingensis]